MLEHEVAVEQDRLDLRQQRVFVIDVSPAGLHHCDLRVDEERHRPGQEVGSRHEVGIEDRDEVALRDVQAGLERTGLEARAIRPMEIGDIDALRGVSAHRLFGNLHVSSIESSSTWTSSSSRGYSSWQTASIRRSTTYISL